MNSLAFYYTARKKAGVPVEMHLHAHDGHASGLAAHSAFDSGVASVDRDMAGDFLISE